MADNKPIVLFHTEEFKFEKVKGEDLSSTKILISGNAQPLFEDSRNGVRYRSESVKKAYNSLNGVSFLYNHNTDKPLGHVSNAGLSATHVTYEADIDPEERDYIRKVERGDIKHVSVGCMVENVTWNEEDQIYECDVKEYVELSAVPVPGFANTSASKEGAVFLANALGDTAVLEKLTKEAEEPEDKDKKDEEVCPKCGKDPCECEEEKCKKKKASVDGEDENPDKKDEEEDPEEKPKDEALKKEADGSAEPTADEKMASLIAQVSDLAGKVETIVSSISALESKIEVIQNEKEKEADKKPEETPDETDAGDGSTDEEEKPEDNSEEPKPKEDEKPKEEEKLDITKLNPDASEKFVDEKIRAKDVENEKKKAEVLGIGKEAKDVKNVKDEKNIDVTKLRMKNIRY